MRRIALIPAALVVCGMICLATPVFARSATGQGPVAAAPLLPAPVLPLVSPSVVEQAAALPPLSIPIDLDQARLKPGEFLWFPEIAPAGPLVIVVNIIQQQAHVYRNGVRIAVSTVSTGKKGHETPTGVFTILQKHKDHKSSLYDDAPMPYMQRLTWDGVALHAGKLPGYPASHGCVRLPMEFARRLFGLTTFGITVIVTNESATPTEVAHAGVFSAATTEPSASAVREPRLNWFEQYRWRPELALEGPLTVVLSAADRRVLVMRNGVEIGRARFELLGDAPLNTHAYVMLEGRRAVPSRLVPQRNALNWLQIDLPGYANAGPQELDPESAGRVILPARFAQALYDVLTPGTTLLVTDAPVLPQTTGAALTVMTAGVPADEQAPPAD